MALGDAIVLAKCPCDVPDAEKAFATCERLRKGRVKELAETTIGRRCQVVAKTLLQANRPTTGQGGEL